jgi:lipoyl(octanoyl) transferase
VRISDLGTLRYRDAWAAQEQVHAEVLGGAEERLLLVEHPPVITFGRRAETQGQKNLISSKENLDKLGVELVQSDRGGDVTIHGPGQVVAYPIVRLNDHRLSVGGYVRRLEQTVIEALGELGVSAQRVEGCVGVWVQDPLEDARGWGTTAASSAACGLARGHDHAKPQAAIARPSALSKICAIGVRIKRGVSMHGIALHVLTDLRYFDLIVPCGLGDKRVTSLKRILGESCPSIDVVKRVLSQRFLGTFTAAG